jgi:ribonuclease-3
MELAFQNDSPIILVDPPPLNREEIEKIVGTKINDINFYQRAFTHKSALKNYNLTESFETLEFMGDSVLGFVITKMLFDKYSSKQEGFLTIARTKLVRGNTLAHIAGSLNLDKWILMDEKGIRQGWHRNEKVLEDVFEAFIGAIYLDLGMVHAKRFILDLFSNPTLINMDYLMVDDNYKDQLMRYCQSRKLNLPQYDIVTHDNNIFHMSVSVEKQIKGYGQSKNKKKAEQQGAYNALIELREITI